jgi:general secretion pathway protein J
MKPRQSPVQQGLTLLEMMIALVLLSLLLMLLFGGLRLASRSWDRGSAFTDNVSQMQLVENFMRREISQAEPYRLKQDPQDPKALLAGYEGQSHRLRFVASMPAAAARGGLYVLTFALMPHGDGKALILLREPVDRVTSTISGQDGDDTANAPLVLIDGVSHLDFSYFGVPAGSQSPPSWQPSWPDSTNAPQLIRMRVQLADGSTWPDLVVAPRVDMAAAASIR